MKDAQNIPKDIHETISETSEGYFEFDIMNNDPFFGELVDHTVWDYWIDIGGEG